MKNIFPLIIAIVVGCANTSSEKNMELKQLPQQEETAEPLKPRRYAGALSNGMKGDSLFFDVSADGKKLENLTFKGYWRCSGKLEKTTVGPDGAFIIKNGKVDDHITEPPGGGSTAWRYDLLANIQGNKASGTFRMNINDLGCDTYKLNWTAVAK